MNESTSRKKLFTRGRVINFFGFLAVLLLIGVLVSTQIRVDKVIIEPGSADSVAESIEFHDVKTYEPEGTIRFLSVFVSGNKPSLAEYWKAKYISDNVEILPWKEVNGDQTPQESSELNKALMTSSQNAATVVALNKIGCDITESGTGAIISLIEKKSPASKNLKVGDVIVEIDGKPVALNSDATEIIRSRKAGDTISVVVERGEKNTKKTIDVELGSSPYQKNTPFLGVATVTRDLEFDFPVSISFDPGAVSGPSAGAAFTLSIIDQLTEGELTGGKDIAVTGEIGLDGSINHVGGVAQKAIAARDAGAKVLLVPKGEGKSARKNAGSMKVFEVTTLSQALDILVSLGGDPLPQMQSCPTS